SALGAATIAGLQDNKVIACGKHFPGHGDTTADSHKELPTMTGSADRLHQMELRPFRYAIEHGLTTIMTAHVSYPNLDAKYPATLSSTILTDLLRNQLGFDGLIFTDDLEMQAIIDHYGIEEAAILAFQAGADILLICKDHDREVKTMEAVYQAVKDGTISEQRLG
ncbi:MAG: beta-N-acetylhexosaminidase, partial [Nitrospiraceae bacterium]